MIKTGIKLIDDFTNGMKRIDFLLIDGVFGEGLSAIKHGIIKNVLEDNGRILFFSYYVNEIILEKINKLVSQKYIKNITIVGSSTQFGGDDYSIEKLRKMLLANDDYDLILIDSINFLNESFDKYPYLFSVTNELAIVSVNHKVPIIALAFFENAIDEAKRNHSLLETKVFNVTNSNVDYYLFINDDSYNEIGEEEVLTKIDAIVMDYKGRKKEGSYYYDNEKEKMFEFNTDFEEMYNNALAIGLNSHDAVDYALNWKRINKGE